MKDPAHTASLKNAIELLEIERACQKQQLKDQFDVTYDGLRPANLIKSTLRDIASSPMLVEGAIGTTIGVASGFLVKKVVVGRSEGAARNILGAILQVAVTNLVAKNAGSIRVLGNVAVQYLIDRRERRRTQND